MYDTLTREKLQAWLDAQIGSLVQLNYPIDWQNLEAGDIGLVVAAYRVTRDYELTERTYGVTYLFKVGFCQLVSPKSAKHLFEVINE